MKLDEYVTLGRTGVLVSPLCLGAMTFGNDWGWGADEQVVQRMIDAYRERGGNFIDTADGYTGGSSERILGRYMAERKNRDEIVLATKFTFHAGMNPSAGPSPRANPNLGGNSRKNIYRAIEASLQRLQTDYIDLYWMHVWDGITPVEEVLSTIDSLVREGKVRYFGLSDVPAWYAARGQTWAELRGMNGIAALQLEYSLVERGIEREHIPVAQELGMAVCPWSPLASGFLSGKYKRDQISETQGRLARVPAFGPMKSDRSWAILDVVLETAQQLGRSPAEIALNWVATRPGVTSTIIGVTKPEQLDSNITALEVTIPPELEAKLDEASKLPSNHPYSMFQPAIRARIHGGAATRRWRP